MTVQTEAPEGTIGSVTAWEPLDEEVLSPGATGNRLASSTCLRVTGSGGRQGPRLLRLRSRHDDVVQEGMIGLYKAIRDYRSDRLVRFRAFAEICITRQIISAVKSAARQKHLPLNQYVSLHRPTGGRGLVLMDVLADGHGNEPEAALLTVPHGLPGTGTAGPS